MAERKDLNASLADYKENTARKQPMGNTKPKEHSARKTPLGNTKPKEHLAQKRTKIDKAIANAQAFQKQRTALMNMSTKDKLGAALESSIIGAATGGGIIAAQKGIRAAVNSGIPARAINKVTGQIVVVHGTGRPIVGKTINPMAGSAYSPDTPAAFAWNTKFAERSDVGLGAIHSNLQEYSNRPYYSSAAGKEVPGQGNIVIGKTKMKNAIPHLSGNSVIASKTPIKITKIIKEDAPAMLFGRQQKEYFIKELKRAGVPVKPTLKNQMLDKAEAAKLARRIKESNKNSVV
jgi:hypothetical protein